MTLFKKYSVYVAVGGLAALGVLALGLRRHEAPKRAEREQPSPPAAQIARGPSLPAPSAHARQARPPTLRATPRPPASAPLTLEQEMTRGLPSWEGKQMRDYTPEEREATGLTNEKLFSSAGSAHWRVLAGHLEGKVDEKLREEMLVLADSYREAASPYAYDAKDENLEHELSLLPRVQAAIGASTLPYEAQRSLAFLQRHAKMWENGEAATLVERKMEREDDVAKRLALRQRKNDDPAAQAERQADP